MVALASADFASAVCATGREFTGARAVGEAPTATTGTVAVPIFD